MSDPISTPFLRQLVYTSHLAPGLGAEVVSAVLQVSRIHNPEALVTGALLFDGARFVQLLEGETAAVGALLRRIAADPRHVEFKLWHDAASTRPRCCKTWVAGYAEVDQVDHFVGACAAPGRDVVDEVAKLVALADVI